MASALEYIASLALGQQASGITGQPNDAFLATGYSAFIQALTGETPTITQIPGTNKARMVLTTKQNEILKKWFETRVAASMKIAKAPSNLDLNANTYIMPTVLKYAFPAAIVVFIAGWVVHSMATR